MNRSRVTTVIPLARAVASTEPAIYGPLTNPIPTSKWERRVMHAPLDGICLSPLLSAHQWVNLFPSRSWYRCRAKSQSLNRTGFSACSAQFGSTGSVKSTPSAIITVPLRQPKTGWFFLDTEPDTVVDVESRADDSPEFRFSKILRNTSFSLSMLTFEDLYPASSQACVMTLLEGLLLHHAQCLRAEGGNLSPINFSIRENVI